MALEKTVLDVELNTGEVHTIRVTNRSKVAYDLTRPKRKWDPADEAPFIFLTFLAFHALVIVEKLVDCKWEQFVDEVCVEIASHDGQDAEQKVLDVYKDAVETANVKPAVDDSMFDTEPPAERNGDPVDPTQPAVEFGTASASQ